jgi:hypothetical protein
VFKRSPGATAIILMVLGSLGFIMLLNNLPFPNGDDVNGDGISDNFQKIHPVEDVIKDGDEWRIETVGHTSDPDITFLLFSGSILIIFLPTGIALWQWNGPRREERIRKWKEEGKMHDSVRRIAAFLEINPSLSSAIKLTRTSLSERDQVQLGGLVWAPITESRSFDDIYSEFSSNWSERSPIIGDAFTGLSSAEKESGRTEIMLSARSVVERLSDGSRSLMEAYSRSLTGPSTALFGLGVLLPILLATMIPVAGISGRTAILIGTILWFILPAGILLIGSRLVLKRPSLGTMDLPSNNKTHKPKTTDIFILILGSLFLIVTIHLTFVGQVPEVFGRIGLDVRSMMVLTSLLCLSFLSAGFITIAARGQEIGENNFADVRSRSPKFLRDISSSVREGHSFEHALKRSLMTSEIRKGCRDSLMPGETISKAGFPEPLSSYLESANEFSKAGKGPGGKAIRAFSRHIHELLVLEKDLSSRVRNAVGQMEVTASIFAPLMIGISAGIFTLMDSVGGDVPEGMLFSSNSSSTMEPAHFLLMASGYLFMLSIVTTLTIYRLENGRTGGGWHRVPKRLMQSSLAFSLGVVGSSLLMG